MMKHKHLNIMIKNKNMKGKNLTTEIGVLHRDIISLIARHYLLYSSPEKTEYPLPSICSQELAQYLIQIFDWHYPVGTLRPDLYQPDPGVPEQDLLLAYYNSRDARNYPLPTINVELAAKVYTKLGWSYPTALVD